MADFKLIAWFGYIRRDIVNPTVITPSLIHDTNRLNSSYVASDFLSSEAWGVNLSNGAPVWAEDKFSIKIAGDEQYVIGIVRSMIETTESGEYGRLYCGNDVNPLYMYRRVRIDRIEEVQYHANGKAKVKISLSSDCPYWITEYTVTNLHRINVSNPFAIETAFALRTASSDWYFAYRHDDSIVSTDEVDSADEFAYFDWFKRKLFRDGSFEEDELTPHLIISSADDTLEVNGEDYYAQSEGNNYLTSVFKVFAPAYFVSLDSTMDYSNYRGTSTLTANSRIEAARVIEFRGMALL